MSFGGAVVEDESNVDGLYLMSEGIKPADDGAACDTDDAGGTSASGNTLGDVRISSMGMTHSLAVTVVTMPYGMM